MGSIIDMIGALIFGGLLLLTAARLERFVVSTQQQSNFDSRTQQNCIQLGEILENDLYGAGAGVSQGTNVFLSASPDSLRFKYDPDGNGVPDSVSYYAGPKNSAANPNQRSLVRIYDGVSQKMNLGLTNLKFFYYDSFGTATIVLKNIIAVRVKLDVESDFRSVTAGGTSTPGDVLGSKPGAADTVYNGVHWEQYIVPKRLHY